MPSKKMDQKVLVKLCNQLLTDPHGISPEAYETLVYLAKLLVGPDFAAELSFYVRTTVPSIEKESRVFALDGVGFTY